MTAVGITGHQERQGIDWAWVRYAIGETLDETPHVNQAYTSLARGADQVFAEVVIKRHIPLVAVIPLHEYSDYFSGPDLKRYLELLEQANVVQLEGGVDDESAFFQAGKYIVDHTDVLFAVWDGEPAVGFGGTEDIVSYACSIGRPVVHIEPVSQSVNRQ